MRGRAASPAPSENAFDITNALVSASESETENSILSKKPTKDLRNVSILAEDGGSSGDEGFIAGIQAAANRKSSNIKGKSVKKGGGFQAMGLSGNLLKAIAHKGFSVPTPIQRKTIPLVMAGQDVVGMARTGSGKTAAFVVPMIEKLKQHSTEFGARALIMSPSRELALQTLKVVKEFGRHTNLRCALIVGGDRLEEQFQVMRDFPDIVVATLGRFLHIKLEMELTLSTYKYVVFDEADRIFEMALKPELDEILKVLPSDRQTLLFSATLPTTLVDFAKAGLREPKLVRLDSESKVSPDLQSAFFTIKSADKEGALLHILQDVIKMPTGETEVAKAAKAGPENPKKRKRSETAFKPNESPTEHSTIIFTATKHHVEYIASLLRLCGYSVSYVYGSLDQTARKIHINDFRTGRTNILVVTDVAARGIDIPILANVINYDFPAQPKIFVHRVGRTARAGQRGWSYSLVKESDCPYLLDLQLFLAKKLILGRAAGGEANFAEDVIVGGLPKDKVSSHSEWVSKMLDESIDLAALKQVAGKGEKLYQRTRNAASLESVRRSKEVSTSNEWTTLHPLFKDENNNAEAAREAMLARISGFRPPETIFEVGMRGNQGDATTAIRKRRELMEIKRRKEQEVKHNPTDLEERQSQQEPISDVESSSSNDPFALDEEDFNDAESTTSTTSLEVTITHSSTTKPKNSKSTTNSITYNTTKDENYMSYTPSNTNIHETRGYSLSTSTGSTFLSDARAATMNLTADESNSFSQASKPSLLKWSKRHKKYIPTLPNGDSTTDSNKKYIRSESGTRIPASFRSGKFDAWAKTQRLERLPRAGELERANASTTNTANGPLTGGRRFKHRQEKVPKAADKYRDDYHVRKKRVAEAKEKRLGIYKDGEGKSEVRDFEGIGRERLAKEKRREKTGRHHGGGKGTARGGFKGKNGKAGGRRR
jgi:ATP-dependent RNA helicase DDX54/DBP10